MTMAALETDRYPHITVDLEIQGGAAVVRGTRLPVRAIAFYWRETADRARILSQYPQLTAETLDEVIHYYEAHRTEIDEELRAESKAA